MSSSGVFDELEGHCLILWQRLDLISSELVGRALEETLLSHLTETHSGHYGMLNRCIDFSQVADMGSISTVVP